MLMQCPMAYLQTIIEANPLFHLEDCHVFVAQSCVVLFKNLENVYLTRQPKLIFSILKCLHEDHTLG